MKKLVFSFVFLVAAAATTSAQTFTDHVQKSTNGGGKVTVQQSKEIDDLVNGKAQTTSPTTTPTTVRPASTASATPTPSTTKPQDSNAVKKHEEHTSATPTATPSTSKPHESEAAHNAESKAATNAPSTTPTTATATETTAKKVVRGGHKVTGYRVQVYAGGNTRDDKVKATEAGNAVKRKFPEQPVYVHFYSPRWICRVGNFRTYQEAQKLLTQIKAMGYKAATIVSGKITVQY